MKSPVAAFLNRIGDYRKHRGKAPGVKAFRENQEKEEAFDTIDLGIRQVPISRIVGSVGRYQDFDNRFRLKHYLPQDRLKGIQKAMQSGTPLKPVQLYQIKDEYYVFDGNHRVSAAKGFGFGDIDAHIIEFLPSKNALDKILYHERAEFNNKTGLPHPVELTELGQYPYLIKQISRHRDHLEQEKDGPVSLRSAAADWYRTIYSPFTAIIRKAHLLTAFPKRTVADLYAYISFHQWEKGSVFKYGSGIDQFISNNMEDFRKNMSDKKELEYPEMLREITAFVLMHVSGKREEKVMDRLFALEEVREAHSVHGDVDIIAKIVLTRDLVSSDAETIGNFVHTRIRQIPGVISTQTLIPSNSKIKKDGAHEVKKTGD